MRTARRDDRHVSRAPPGRHTSAGGQIGSRGRDPLRGGGTAGEDLFGILLRSGDQLVRISGGAAHINNPNAKDTHAIAYDAGDYVFVVDCVRMSGETSTQVVPIFVPNHELEIPNQNHVVCRYCVGVADDLTGILDDPGSAWFDDLTDWELFLERLPELIDPGYIDPMPDHFQAEDPTPTPILAELKNVDRAVLIVPGESLLGALGVNQAPNG